MTECSNMKEFTSLQGFLAFAGPELIIVPVLAMALLGFIFWLWMLIDCLTNEPSEGNDKLVWVLVIFFGNFLGAILYFFIRRKERLLATGK